MSPPCCAARGCALGAKKVARSRSQGRATLGLSLASWHQGCTSPRVIFPWAQYDTNQSSVRGDSPVPSVCTAHQAEPEEAEAEVPQVSPQLPSHSFFFFSFAFSSVPAPLAVLRGHVSHANGRNIVTGQRSLESSLPFICLPYTTHWKTPWNLSQRCN